jgi:tetratricopeptide (TPR) repeat protein
MSDRISADPIDSPPQPATEHKLNPFDTFVDQLIGGLNTWERLVAIVVAVCTALANLKLLLEQQWVFVVVMLILSGLGVAVYVVSHQRIVANSRHAKLVRFAAISSLVSVPLITFVTFGLITISPRVTEHGPIFAIARFQGPVLPPPYQDCRPSDMLADAISEVGRDYAHVSAFELPYVIDPNGRSAKWWAIGHGFLEAADSVIYGEYSLVDDEKGDKNPERLLISPEIDQVPTPPLGPKMAPLMRWEFPHRIVRIDQLCTGTAQRFLSDGRRLSLVLSGLQAFSLHEYVSAERSLAQAEDSQENNLPERLFTDVPKGDNSRCDADPKGDSLCSGVLAFYLAALDQRMGNYSKAILEYTFAAAKLNRPAPFVDLAELYVIENKSGPALASLRSAESADPTSVVAAAIRAQYESQYGSVDQARLELDRATELRDEQNAKPAVVLRLMPSLDKYAEISLCRAKYYVEGSVSGLECGRAVFDKADSTNIDAEIEYANWLVASRDDALVAKGVGLLKESVLRSPGHINAYYSYAKALSKTGSSDTNSIRTYYMEALDARAFTDDELTDQANSATALEQIDKEVSAKRQDFRAALSLYHAAILKNDRCAYAYSNRSTILEQHGQWRAALRDLRMAILLHPREQDLTARLRDLSKAIRRPAREPRALSSDMRRRATSKA